MFNLPSPDYYQYVIRRFLEARFTNVSRLPLPMIDLSDSKQNALPSYLWGLLWMDWEPTDAGGQTVFLTDYQARGPDNALKRIYFSALTPDLIKSQYNDRISAFWRQLLGPVNDGLPLMNIYLSQYWNLYWDLHLGLDPSQIPAFARDIGTCFNTCLADINVFDPGFHDNYMRVRELRPSLDAWLDVEVGSIAQELAQGSTVSDNCFVYYWLANGGEQDNVVFECFHNFVALSQWGNTIYNVMDLLREGGDATIRAKYDALMSGDKPDERHKGCPFSPMDLFVMELYRTITPNTGSISVLSSHGKLNADSVYQVYQHAPISHDPLHWEDPASFRPDRYLERPTSDQTGEPWADRMALARCPFEPTSTQVRDGREVTLTNSGYGTLYAGGAPVCDDAGYSPFGFGYRRCPGELLSVAVIKDFLTVLWAQEQQGAVLKKLSLRDPQRVPVGPGAIVVDDIGLVRSSSR